MKKSLLSLASWMVVLFALYGWADAQEPVPAAQAPSDTPPAAAPAPEVKAPTAADLLKESDTLWRKRAKKGNALESIAKAEEAMKLGASGFDGNWRIARGAFWVAEWGDKKTKEEYGEKGWKAGVVAQKEKPNRVEGWYFGGIALAQYAKAVGVAAALFRGLGSDYTSMLEKAIQLDKSYGVRWTATGLRSVLPASSLAEEGSEEKRGNAGRQSENSAEQTADPFLSS